MNTNNGVKITLTDILRSLRKTIELEITNKKKYLEKEKEDKEGSKAYINKLGREIEQLTQIRMNISELFSEAIRENRTPERVKQSLNELGMKLNPNEASKLEKMINNNIKEENRKDKGKIGEQIKTIQKIANKLNMENRVISIKDSFDKPIGLSRTFKALLKMIEIEMNKKLNREYIHVHKRGDGSKTESANEINQILIKLGMTYGDLQQLNGIDNIDVLKYIRELETSYGKQKGEIDKKNAEKARESKEKQSKKLEQRVEQSIKKRAKSEENKVTTEDMEGIYRQTSATEKRGLFSKIRERMRKNREDKESEKANE